MTGYQVRRLGDQVRLFTRRSYDWSTRYRTIAVTATLLRAKSFTLDGDAVMCGPDGVAIFDALHLRGTVSEAMLYRLRPPGLCPTKNPSRRYIGWGVRSFEPTGVRGRYRTSAGRRRVEPRGPQTRG
jgi:hypothetical protein